MGKLLIKTDSVTSYCRSIFDKCDKDKDGYITLDELADFIKSNDQVSKSSDIINAYNRFDQNKDDKLDLDEFIDMLTSPTFKKTFTNLANRYVKFLVVPVTRKTVRLQRLHTVTGSYEEQLKCQLRAPPIGILILSILQISFFYCGNDVKDSLTFYHDRRTEIWRYVTYMLVHNSPMHLYFNVIAQIAIGVPLEMVHRWRVLIIYCAGSVGGCLLMSVMYPYDDLMGGSPGFYSVFTAHIASVIMNWREMSHPFSQLVFFSLYTICDTIYSYYKYRDSDTTSYISHLGGAICGLLVGVNILRNLKETRAETILWWISIFTYIALMTTLIMLEILVPR